MSWNKNWSYMSGNLQITVRALDENEDYKKFTFECYVSKEVNSYDRLDNLEDTAYHLAQLRNYYHSEIVEIKQL